MTAINKESTIYNAVILYRKKTIIADNNRLFRNILIALLSVVLIITISKMFLNPEKSKRMVWIITTIVLNIYTLYEIRKHLLFSDDKIFNKRVILSDILFLSIPIVTVLIIMKIVNDMLSGFDRSQWCILMLISLISSLFIAIWIQKSIFFEHSKTIKINPKK